jgi:predicted methyltransferase
LYCVYPKSRNLCHDAPHPGISLDNFDSVLYRFKGLTEARHEPIEQFEQAYVKPETSFTRSTMTAERGNLLNRCILVLGDNDSVGLAAALTGLAVTGIINNFHSYVNQDYLLDTIRHDVKPAMSLPKHP